MTLSANKRIFYNVIATYGRSLFRIVVGLFCGRWTLMALGQVDYGLMGLIAGLIGFVTFFNNLIAQAVGRFYAVSVGAARREGNGIEGVEECRKWFNAALSIHLFLPIILVIIGYPIGVWAVENFLAIPADRVPACIWLWRFTCFSCFVGMVSIPFRAMYGAKQEIAELTIYTFATTTLNALFLYWMVSHPDVWLVKYAMFSCLMSVVPLLIITVRAFYKYPECRFVKGYFFTTEKYYELFKYAFARFISVAASLISGQGRNIVINKFLGPASNAAMASGLNVSHHADTFACAFEGAFIPAIMNLAGEGNVEKVRRFCWMACRVSSVALLVFAIPLTVECHEVLVLWLKNPPAFAAEICAAVMLSIACRRMTDSYASAILGFGKGIMLYSWLVGIDGFAVIGSMIVFCSLGFGLWSVCISLAIGNLVTIVVRLICGKYLVGFSLRHWVAHVFTPVVTASAIAAVAGYCCRFWLSPSFLRVVVSTAACEVVFLPLVWFWVLDVDERGYVLSILEKKLPILQRFAK